MISSRAFPGAALLTAPFRAAAVMTRLTTTATVAVAVSAGSTALSGGRIATERRKSLAGVAPDLAAMTRAAAGMALETLGGPPARRTSSNDSRRWIEVRGLGGEHGSAIAAEVLKAVRSTPGVRDVRLIRSAARVVVTVDPDGPSAAQLCRIVTESERRSSADGFRHQPTSLPGDDEVLVARAVAAAAATAGFGLALTGSVLRLPGLPDLLAVPTTVIDHAPWLRHHLERRLGPEGTDLLFGVVNAMTAALTLSPTAAAAEVATRSMLAAEAWNGRLTWQRKEAGLASHRLSDAPPPREIQDPPDGPAESYAHTASAVGVGAAVVLGLLSGNVNTAGAAALAAVPKPLRASREAFGCAVSRGLAANHDTLVLRPRTLRTLDRVDAIVIDPRALYTRELMVSRVLGVQSSRRAHAWEAVRTALAADGLEPGWHKLSAIPGAGRSGKALVSPVRDPFANAVVTEARKSSARVISLHDDGLRSLAQGFDDLHPLGESTDQALTAAVAGLKADGATVLLLTTPEMRSPHEADIVIGLLRDRHPPPWGADVFVPDLIAAWRLLHAISAARSATQRGVRLSASASAIGALMLIPSVVGRGPEAADAGVAAALWSGFTGGTGVFRQPLPEPESVQDWHALPVSEVQRLLPRPPDEHDKDQAARWQDLPPVRGLRHITLSSWHLAHDFVGEMRANLSDPITPLLATGAAASALLGSPLDAALVSGVLLANAALSAEQQLHAERILRRLLAVQDPLARRVAGTLDERRHEKVPAKRLRPGDVIEVHADEVIPADARLIEASNVEVDESALTGESLPVSKQTEATPGAPLAERACMLYAGSTMVAGTAVAVVTAVGSRSEMRRALAMAPAKSREIGLQHQLSRITRRALPFSVAGGGLVGLLSVFRGTPLRDAVGSAVALTVAAVPEGLPLVATLAQLASARRLSRESVLVRNAQSVEALARLEVICFDKTGTLSENRLQVKSVRPVTKFTAAEVLDAAVTTVFIRPGHHAHHATDDAIRRAIDGSPGGQQPIERDAFLPFQSGRPFAAGLVGTRMTIKGAPEVLSSALVDGDEPFAQMIAEMTTKGLRVLAVAERELSPNEAAAAVADPAVLEKYSTSGLTAVGLLGLADTPRPGARALLEELSDRGIEIRLITGDHPVTAAVVAEEMGLQVSAEQVITGSEWETLSATARAEAVSSHLVFARMTPEHKIDIVRTLERTGHVTAMVGDGANDAAAIRAASVGIGVAARGSDPARTAADMILLDGRIEALLDALDEAQQLWRRVQSAVSMLLGGNTGEVCFALITSLLTGRSVLNARQMLLVNMLTDALPAAALAVSMQTSTAEVDRDEAAMWRAIGVRGGSTTLGATLAWLMASATGTRRRAATVALIGLVATQLAQTLADSRGRLVVFTAAGSFAVLAAVISTPGLSHLFGCTPIGPLGWSQAFLATAVAGLLSALAPELLFRISESARQLVSDAGADVDDSVVHHDDADLHEDGVDLAKGRRQETNTGHDQGVMAGTAHEIGHIN